MAGLSERGVKYLDEQGIDQIRGVLSDPYDRDSNPGGLINMGTAENYVMLPEIAKFTNEKLNVASQNVSYGEGPWGDKALCQAMARYLNKYLKPVQAVQPEELLFTDGVTAMIEMLGYTLFNEGDGVLLSRPIYQAFKPDFGLKAGVQLVLTNFDDVDQFSTDAIVEYEATLKRAEAEGIKIRALLLCHPHNPLGKCYPKETIVGLMQLCNKYGIHLLSDEIYALSVYDVPDPTAVKYESVISFDSKEYINPDLLHLIYGFSKDLAASGLRLGVFHTHNKDLFKAMGAIIAPHWSGSVNQRLARLMLDDEEWVDEFLRRSRKYLADRNAFARQLLEKNGLEFLKGSNAGFFLWVDLRRFLNNDPAGKRNCGSAKDAWDAENQLSQRMMEHKVFLTPGGLMFAAEPGWFRLIFSQDKHVLEEGVGRLVKAL